PLHEPGKEEVSGRDELLRTDGRDGCSGTIADSAAVAGDGEGYRRGGCVWGADVPRSRKSRFVQSRAGSSPDDRGGSDGVIRVWIVGRKWMRLLRESAWCERCNMCRFF